MEELEIKLMNEGDVGVMELRGTLDLYTAPSLKKQLNNYIDKHQSPKCLIDLNEVEYMDSSGLGVIIYSNNNVKKLKGALGIVNINDSVKKVFELTKLHSFFNCYASREIGLKELQK